MRAVVQRVKKASININNAETTRIGPGLLVFLGVTPEDTQKDIDYISDKIQNLRVFEDEDGKMNLSALDKDLELLIVSQFTLYGDCRKGRRPSFIRAGNPKDAKLIYDDFIKEIKKSPLKVETGEFQADMQVELLNDGPVTLLLDSSKDF